MKLTDTRRKERRKRRTKQKLKKPLKGPRQNAPRMGTRTRMVGTLTQRMKWRLPQKVPQPEGGGGEEAVVEASQGKVAEEEAPEGDEGAEGGEVEGVKLPWWNRRIVPFLMLLSRRDLDKGQGKDGKILLGKVLLSFLQNYKAS
jgi:hypothetical protein